MLRSLANDTNDFSSAPKTPSVDALPVQWADDIEASLDNNWLIQGVLPTQGAAALYGHSGAGKSFVAEDIGMRVALGWSWQGRDVRQGLVIYIAAEGAHGLRNRIVAFRRHHDISCPVPFAIIPLAVDLQAVEGDVQRVIATVNECQAKTGPAALIIIDTLSKTFGGGAENTDDMVSYVRNIERLAAHFQACVIAVHHRPKDNESTELRGHSSLRAGVETTLLVEAGQPRKVTVKKQKDGPDGDRFYFDLAVVSLGTAANGEEVTSAVVVPCEVRTAMERDPTLQKISKLTDKNKLIFRLLGDVIASDGTIIPAQIPDSVIDRNRVGKCTVLNKVSDKVLSAIRTGSDTKPDSDRRSFDRALLRLQTLDLIGIWEGFTWIK